MTSYVSFFSPPFNSQIQCCFVQLVKLKEQQNQEYIEKAKTGKAAKGKVFSALSIP